MEWEVTDFGIALEKLTIAEKLAKKYWMSIYSQTVMAIRAGRATLDALCEAGKL